MVTENVYGKSVLHLSKEMKCGGEYEAVKKKHRAWNTYIHTLDQTDYRAYCRIRNKCTKITRKAKRKFEKNVASDMKDNPKGFWGYIKQKTRFCYVLC